MKDKKTSGIKKILLILAAMTMLSLFSAVSAHAAATTATAAYNTYKSLLANNPSSIRSFGVFYLNNDSIPDLVAVGQTDDGAYLTLIYYINGERVYANGKKIRHYADYGAALYYYPKKNMTLETYTFNQYYHRFAKIGSVYDAYNVLGVNRQKASPVYVEIKWYAVSSNAKDPLRGASYKTVSTTLAQFNSLLNGYVGSTAAKKVTLHTNNSTNRTNYLKAASKKSQTITTRKDTYNAVFKQNGVFYLNASAKTSLSYSSSNTSVATVSSAGKITIKGYGSASITIKAKATTTYKSATKVVVVNIKPVQMTITSVKTAGAGKFTMQWNTDSRATGYQLQCSKYSDFSSKSTYTCSSNTKYKATVTTGVNGQTYYVRARAFKTMNGQKIYGPWSAVRTVKTGK